MGCIIMIQMFIVLFGMISCLITNAYIGNKSNPYVVKNMENYNKMIDPKYRYECYVLHNKDKCPDW